MKLEVKAIDWVSPYFEADISVSAVSIGAGVQVKLIEVKEEKLVIILDKSYPIIEEITGQYYLAQYATRIRIDDYWEYPGVTA